jgi:hypothetical protein
MRLNQCPARPNRPHKENTVLRDADWVHKLRLGAGVSRAVQDAIAELSAIEPAEFEALGENDTLFAFGEMKLPFTGANFLLSFAQPNFYFHATTAYAILRAQGVKVGKGDFMGMPRIKR